MVGGTAKLFVFQSFPAGDFEVLTCSFSRLGVVVRANCCRVQPVPAVSLNNNCSPSSPDFCCDISIIGLVPISVLVVAWCIKGLAFSVLVVLLLANGLAFRGLVETWAFLIDETTGAFLFLEFFVTDKSALSARFNLAAFSLSFCFCNRVARRIRSSCSFAAASVSCPEWAVKAVFCTLQESSLPRAIFNVSIKKTKKLVKNFYGLVKIYEKLGSKNWIL